MHELLLKMALDIMLDDIGFSADLCECEREHGLPPISYRAWAMQKYLFFTVAYTLAVIREET